MTSIEWTDEVWNPVTGCTKVSEGCRNCYAERIAHRFWGARPFTDVRIHPERLEVPLHWKKPRTIFVNSMSDLFHEKVSDAIIDRVFAVMALCPQHTFQVLSKRPDRMEEYLRDSEYRAEMVAIEVERIMGGGRQRCTFPLPNAHMLVSAEDQKSADERVSIILRTPAAVRGVSLEPLLGPVDLRYSAFNGADSFGSMEGLHWVVVGGESGPNARACDPEWIRSIIDQCHTAGVPCFVKQLGSNPMPINLGFVNRSPSGTLRAALVSRKGNDPMEWPDYLRVREMPRG